MDNHTYSRRVLRAHGAFLVALTTIMLIASTLGTFRGVGPFAFLEPNPLAHVGLFQAYALMMVVGIALWLGSSDARPLKWDVIGMLAHVAPLAANFLFADTLAQVGTPSTVPLHTFFILLEASVLVHARVSRNAGRAAEA